MPKVNLNKKQAPPIDWLWAAVLERKTALRITHKELAKLCHVSYSTMRNYAAHSPWAWPPQMRDSALKALGITVTTSVNGTDGVEVRVE